MRFKLAAALLAWMPIGQTVQRAGDLTPLTVVDAPRQSAPAALRRSVGRPFDGSTACSGAVKEGPATIRDTLGSGATRILVHHYAKPAWPNIEVVKDYLE